MARSWSWTLLFAAMVPLSPGLIAVGVGAVAMGHTRVVMCPWISPITSWTKPMSLIVTRACNAGRRDCSSSWHSRGPNVPSEVEGPSDDVALDPGIDMTAATLCRRFKHGRVLSIHPRHDSVDPRGCGHHGMDVIELRTLSHDFSNQNCKQAIMVPWMGPWAEASMHCPKTWAHGLRHCT